MISSKDTLSYIDEMCRFVIRYPELDLILFSLMIKRDIEMLYLSSEGISSFFIKLPFNTKSETDTIRLMLEKDGYYDVVYSKSYIKTAGFCQSFIFDVLIIQ